MSAQRRSSSPAGARGCPTRRLTSRALGVALACGLALVCQGPPARAAAASPASPGPRAPAWDRLYYSSAIYGRLNPQGLIERAELGYRRLLTDSQSLLLKDTYAGVAFAPSASPAWGRLGIMAEVVPLAVLRLRVQYDYTWYPGWFGNIQSFRSPWAEHSDTALAAGKDAGRAYGTSGDQLTLAARVQGKVWHIAARSEAQLVRIGLDLRAGDRVFYDQIWDVDVPNGGWIGVVDTDLLFLAPSRWLPGTAALTIGLRHTYTQALYRAGDYAPGERRVDPNSPTHRLGLLVAYRFWKEPGTLFDEPTAFVMAQWWLKQRYRTGADVSQAIPYFVFGFAFRGERWLD